jgi:hypothetical protein
LFHEVADLTAQFLKADRNVLVFTFKDKGKKKPRKVLREQIQHYLGGTAPEHQGTGDLNIVTWGNETALNNYSHCDVVLFAGLMTLPHAAVAAKIVAHANDCQRRSKSSPSGRSKTSPLDVKQRPVLRVVPVVHRRDPRCFV